MDLNIVLTAVGAAVAPTIGGVTAFYKLKERLVKLETQGTDGKELDSAKDVHIIAKLDAIAEKIDLRCDALDKRLERVERKVLNGEYHKS